MGNTPNIRFKGFSDDWEQRKLGDVIIDYNEKNPKNEELPVLTSSRQGIQKQEDHFGSTQKHDTTDYNVIPKGYCTYRNRSDDKSFKFNINNIVERGLVSKFYPVFGLRECNAKFITEYLNYSPYITNELAVLAVGTSQVVLSLSTLKKLKILLPNTHEQNRIGDYLEELDNLITLHQRKCDETKELKKFMLQKMFPKDGEKIPEIRFAGFTEDWEQRKLGEVVDFLDTMRKPLEGAKRVLGPYPYYGASGIVDYVDGYLFDEELVLLSEDGANITDRNYPVCFLASGKYWVNNHAHVLKPKSGNENNFICNSLERKDYKQYNSGMAMPKLNQEVCRNIPVSCPVYEEQKKIGDFFRSLDNLITLHQRKCDEIKELKKYMLQNMFPQKG